MKRDLLRGIVGAFGGFVRKEKPGRYMAGFYRSDGSSSWGPFPSERKAIDSLLYRFVWKNTGVILDPKSPQYRPNQVRFE